MLKCSYDSDSLDEIVEHDIDDALHLEVHSKCAIAIYLDSKSQIFLSFSILSIAALVWKEATDRAIRLRSNAVAKSLLGRSAVYRDELDERACLRFFFDESLSANNIELFKV